MHKATSVSHHEYMGPEVSSFIYHKELKETGVIRRKWWSGVEKSPLSAPTFDLRPI
jgi:hypothetical protein